jgi:hypothetical protein
MSLILPHHLTVQRHSTMPIWRIRCSCGWTALAAAEEAAKVAQITHLETEEPFPDLDHLLKPGAHQ